MSSTGIDGNVAIRGNIGSLVADRRDAAVQNFFTVCAKERIHKIERAPIA
jgi:hypothetical protein